MNHILFFSIDGLNDDHYFGKDEEFKAVINSIDGLNLKGDFCLDVSSFPDQLTYNQEMGEVNFKIMYFPSYYSLNQEWTNGKDVYQVRISNLEVFLKKKTTKFLCLIFNGDFTAQQAKYFAQHFAQYSTISIGSNRKINSREGYQFISNFFKILNSQRVVYSKTILEAFHQAQINIAPFKHPAATEKPFVFFTKKICSTTLKEQQPTSIMSINTTQEYHELKTILNQLEAKYERIEELEGQLPNAHIHLGMSNWLNEKLDDRIEEVVENVMTGASKEDIKNFSLDIEDFLFNIKMCLKFNEKTTLIDHDISCRFSTDKYELAFKLLDKRIPLEGSFQPHSRHFLSQLLNEASSYIY